MHNMAEMECVLLLVLLFGCASPVTCFESVQWSTMVSSSQQCGVDSSSDLSDAINTVAQLIKSTTSFSSLPKSCMEIKESSPVSPSGYYTISSGTSGSAEVVYCNMDDLYSCPALEQTLSGIKKDVDSLFTHIDSPLFSSCLEVKERCPQCKSGVYEIGPDMNNVNFVSCNFDNYYCNTTGPWVKLASWDISQSGSSCPSGLQLFVNKTVSACGVQEGSSVGCQSLPLFSSPVPYTQVCGRIRGYQKGSGDAFVSGIDINGAYIDGVSITRGSPRQHVWTYAIGVQENIPLGGYQCPCNSDSSQTPPVFVGSDYFCESGCPAYWDGTTFHAADPLWDGQGCGALEADCCAVPGQPWFHKVLDAPTIDYIEMRLCIDEPTTNENALISSYEIYVL